MIVHGFPLKGCTFEWDYAEDYTADQMTSIETMLLNNFEVEGSYFEEKYGIKILGRRAPAPAPVPPSGGDEEKDEEKIYKMLRGFFAQAPRPGGDPLLFDF